MWRRRRSERHWLSSQLKGLKTTVDRDQQRLSEFPGQARAGEYAGGGASRGQAGESEHNAVLLGIDELGRQQVAATTERILREAEFRSATEGDAEPGDCCRPSGCKAEYRSFATALLEQIRNRRSELESEQAQLSIEHGPNFPRVVEIRRQLDDLAVQEASGGREALRPGFAARSKQQLRTVKRW